MLTKSRVIQLLIMLCILIGLFVWRTIDSSVPESKEPQTNTNILIVEEAVCDFLTPCIFNTPWGEFSLSSDHGEILPEKWFNLTLQSNVKNWKVLSAKTVGKTMFMGKIPMMFSAPSSHEGLLQSKAKSMVGACTTDKMIWRFNIVIEVEGKTVDLYYDFMISH